MEVKTRIAEKRKMDSDEMQILHPCMGEKRKVNLFSEGVAHGRMSDVIGRQHQLLVANLPIFDSFVCESNE